MKMFEAILEGIETPMPKPMKESTGEKGLLNYFGENNCFLNVVIQSLWHLDAFRLKFTSEKDLHRHQEHCVYCSLEVIFTQYEFSEESRLPPTVLRETMAILFRPKMKFQLCELDDASEAFDAVLHCLHSQLVDERSFHSLNQCKDTNCVAHKVFGINTIEQIKCDNCGATSDPIRSQVFTTFTYSALLKELFQRDPNLTFCQYLRKGSDEDKRQCPGREKCKAQSPITHYLTALPEVFSVSIAWESDIPNLEDIQTVLTMISMNIDLSNIYVIGSEGKRTPHNYRLRGMICYYGKHYIAFFYNFARKQWFVFDDSNVKAVGTEWSEIQERCIRGRLQPSILFYESQDPINTSQTTEKLINDLSHIKISAVMPTIDVSDDAMTNTILAGNISELKKEYLKDESLATPVKYSIFGDTDPMKSFVVIPHQGKNDYPGDIEFMVTRVNWMYRRQLRVFRFSDDCFKRLVPVSGLEKHVFEYHDVLEVVIVDSNNIIINFYSGQEAQYIHSDRALELVEVLKYKANGKNHQFKIKKQN